MKTDSSMVVSSKKTVIVGASPDPSRYAWLAAKMLMEYGHEIIPLSIKKGEVLGVPIQDIRSMPALENVDTVTLYIGPPHQPEWYDYIIGLHPRRIIFNPGTENDEFLKKAGTAGIETVEGCTLVMLRSKQF